MKAFFKEFRKFIAKGNVMELAIAVIMGSAFGKIVTSMVNDILMPLIGIIAGQSFNTLTVEINGSVIMYGMFIQNVIDFLIIAFCVFIITKVMNKFMAKKEEPKKEEKKSEDILLLEEIRDLLKKQKTSK